MKPTLSRLPLMIVISAVGAGVARAQPNTVSSYSVTHNYFFNTGPSIPITFLNYSVGAYAFEPLPGGESRGTSGQWAVLGPGAFGASRSAGTDRGAPNFVDAGATAGVSANINAWGGGFYSASMTSSGTAHARFAPPNQAFAASWLNTTIVAGWNWRNGQLSWRPIIHDTVSGSAAIRRNRTTDPIMFTIQDAAGADIWAESFFDVWTELSVDMDWDELGLRTGPNPTLAMSITMPASPFHTGSGVLNFNVENGIVTQSEATGFFAGFGLPGLGADVSGGLNLPSFSNNFTFDYDFSNLPGDSVHITLAGSGLGEVTPAPASLALLLLGGVLASARKRR